jgi:hypothetical protein
VSVHMLHTISHKSSIVSINESQNVHLVPNEITPTSRPTESTIGPPESPKQLVDPLLELVLLLPMLHVVDSSKKEGLRPYRFSQSVVEMVVTLALNSAGDSDSFHPVYPNPIIVSTLPGAMALGSAFNTAGFKRGYCGNTDWILNRTRSYDWAPRSVIWNLGCTSLSDRTVRYAAKPPDVLSF